MSATKKPQNTIWIAGYDAYFANKTLEDNPHEQFSDEALEWEAGFKEAAEINDDTEAMGDDQ